MYTNSNGVRETGIFMFGETKLSPYSEVSVDK